MIYKTKNLELHPFIKDDITDDYLSWFSNPEVTKWNSHGLGSYVRKDAEKWLENSKDDIIFGVWIKYDSALKKEKIKIFNNARRTLSGKNFVVKHIGNISLQNINQINRSAEFAIIMGETDYWNKGYATEALKILIDHGFKKMNLHRIWTGTAATNIGMRKVIEKFGFIEEGIFREAIYLNGQYVDVYGYGILKDE